MRKTFNKKVFALLFSLLAFNLLFFSFSINWLQFLPAFPGYGTFGYFAFICTILLFSYLTIDQKPKSKLPVVFAFLSFVFAFTSLLRGSLLDRVLLSLSAFWLIVLTLYFQRLATDARFSLSEFVFAPLLLLQAWARGYRGDSKLARNELPKAPRQLTIISSSLPFARGLVMAVPLLIVIIVFLSSADPVFGNLARQVFQIDINFSWFVQLLISHSFYSLLFILSALPLLYTKVEKKFKEPLSDENQGKYFIELIIVGALVAFVLGVFLVIQFKYLFTSVKETELIQFGIKTYSEYVRRGFTELVFVSIVVYLVSQVSLSVYKKSKNRFLLATNAILLSETVIFIFSIFRRVYLYQADHGFTRSRVYGSGFLLVLLVLTLILIAKHSSLKLRWGIAELGVVLSAIFIVANINVDSLIAQKYPPTVNGQIDYVYISRLSPDAVDGWLTAYSHARAEYSRLSMKTNYQEEDARNIVYTQMVLANLETRYRSLSQKYENETLPKFEKVKRANLSEYTALKKLNKQLPLSQVQELNQKVNALFVNLPPNLMNAQFDRSFSSPLLW